MPDDVADDEDDVVTLVEGPAAFRVRVDTSRAKVAVDVVGRLDDNGWKAIQTALRPMLDAGVKAVILDLSEVTALDPHVVAALVQLQQGRVRVLCAAPSTPALDVLRATGAALVLGVSLG